MQPAPNVAHDDIQQAIILLHRGHEHSGRMRDLAEALVDEQTAVFAWDARGHGRSQGKRGDAEHFGVIVKDFDEFVRHLCGQYALTQEAMVVVGHSVGAVTVSTWVHDYAPKIRGMVLATPAFDVRLFLPLAKPTLRLWHRLRPNAAVKSYVQPWMLTADQREAATYRADELVSPNISVRLLNDMADTAQRVIDDAGAINTPTLVLSAGSDYVVNNRAHGKFFENLSSESKQHITLLGQHHGLFHDTDRHATFDLVKQFVQQSFHQNAPAKELISADTQGYTFDEFQRLSQRLPWHCPKRALFAAQRLTLGTIGRLSRGVQIGLKTGFDSGVSLDHVYENIAEGTTPLGIVLDRFYLDAIGWRGIRQRRVHMQARLREAISAAAASGMGKVRILDVAAGAGRYVLETVRDHPASSQVAIELRDFHQHNLQKAQELAAEWNVGNVTFRQHDAFSSASYAALPRDFDVVIVSGLYELFPHNADILASLAGIRSVLKEGATLIYTNQPWHPQLETIARVLPSHRGGDSWVMRRRTQAEMDQLVARNGFVKTEMDIDRWGIFSVSTSRAI